MDLLDEPSRSVTLFITSTVPANGAADTPTPNFAPALAEWRYSRLKVVRICPIGKPDADGKQVIISDTSDRYVLPRAAELLFSIMPNFIMRKATDSLMTKVCGYYIHAMDNSALIQARIRSGPRTPFYEALARHMSAVA
eukprot:NODE_23048_length_682_cov_4.882883.p1 GENE.NODE_23048_length_682_cov_4.882883~~NODE_23048_length_682_cov_4.882883.p1  ORF type:complete len:139 (-),score=22.74 NODE_23048_length_682_cov_4.882883:209-625(-)